MCSLRLSVRESELCAKRREGRIERADSPELTSNREVKDFNRKRALLRGLEIFLCICRL